MSVTILAAAGLLAACGKRDSLFIEPGKAQPSDAPKKAPPSRP